ncbi:uncharacterized protein LOC128555724 [Mercenaria mercenaria]|uniref:uncharacterized protein LOC128555724 n=1 Tax=Mercenaria mercenaria TaxID=6596 RepID=UPI00234F7609|nr:uncharacterized protein LOC128555724 [Mercenaria mercenaria]
MSFLCSGNKKIAKRLVKLRHFPTQRILDEICLLFGRKSNVTLFICNAICAHIKTKDEHIIDVWAAYTLKRTNSITFVVSLQEEEKTGKKEKAESIPLHKMINYSFIKRRVGEYSYEGTEIINHNAPDEYIDADAYCKLQDCVAKYSVELMKEHRYLSLVSVCSKRSTGYGSTSWELKLGNCIVLYVHTKHYIPINEEPFKPHYDGIPVDVREGAFIPFGRTAVEFLEHVQMGCQICGDNNAKGTLGCFIDHPQYGVCGLTCAHVLLSPWELDWVKTVKSGTSIWPLHSFSKKVYQPTKQDSSIGHAVQLIHKEGSGNNSGMDLALFKLTSRHPKSPDFPNASGVMPAGKINYEHWQICSMDRLNLRTERVVKFGAKTEFRNGVIEFDRLSVKHLNCSLQNEYTTITLHKQIEVRPQILSVAFAEPGDSGALVFLGGENDSEHTCIGIIEGGTTNGTVVVTPIVAILDELKVSSLKSFEAENTISEIHGRIENVGNEVQTVRSEVQNVSTKINTMGSSISGMQEGQQAISSDIQHLKQMVIAISTSPNTQQSTDSPNI